MPKRRVGANLAFLALMLSLAGCVGIPDSGPVAQGDVITDDDDFPFVGIAAPPQTGASQQEILTGFMQAATSAEDNYAIARQFLTADAAAEWNPSRSVLIREGAGLPTSVDADTIDYSVSTRAELAVFGVYTERSTLAQQQLEFGFEQVQGEWRISALEDGIVLSRDNFGSESVFRPYPLYFFDPTYNYLIPDVRWFPASSSISDSIARALLGGQAEWLRQTATLTAFPEGTGLATAVRSQSSRAVVDLTQEAGGTTDLERARMQQQLATSLGALDLSSVSMTVEGAPLAIANPGASDAVLNRAVEASALIRLGDEFGYAEGGRISNLGSITAQVVELDATAVTLARGQAQAAVLSAGGAYLLSESDGDPVLVDARAGIVPPSLDPFGFVWTAPANNPSAIQATASDGVIHAVISDVPDDAGLVSFDVSRDGTRVLMYLQTDAGARLQVGAIIRRDGVPTALGQLVDLPVSADSPIDATWVDDRTVATIARSGESQLVTAFTLGGLKESLGRTDGGVQIAGGNGTEQIRVLVDDGSVLQRRASGWQSTGILADVLATQQ